MNRVIHFEIGAANPERAVKFYQETFGWQITKWPGPEPYWLAATGESSEAGINGGIMRHQDGQPRIVNTIGVESIEVAKAKVTSCGGTVVIDKMAIPGVGYQAYCVDTEGNIFGLHQPDPNA